MTEISIPLTH